MIKFKAGVDANVLTPQIVLAISVAASILPSALVITSLNDGQHLGKPVIGTTQNAHYLGRAVDFRLPDGVSPIDATRQLREALGEQYVVILEADHIHVQFGHIS
jgi:hypothetical protein